MCNNVHSDTSQNTHQHLQNTHQNTHQNINEIQKLQVALKNKIGEIDAIEKTCQSFDTKYTYIVNKYDKLDNDITFIKNKLTTENNKPTTENNNTTTENNKPTTENNNTTTENNKPTTENNNTTTENNNTTTGNNISTTENNISTPGSLRLELNSIGMSDRIITYSVSGNILSFSITINSQINITDKEGYILLRNTNKNIDELLNDAMYSELTIYNVSLNKTYITNVYQIEQENETIKLKYIFDDNIIIPYHSNFIGRIKLSVKCCVQIL
jgi:hypothetical protein